MTLAQARAELLESIEQLVDMFGMAPPNGDQADPDWLQNASKNARKLARDDLASCLQDYETELLRAAGVRIKER